MEDKEQVRPHWQEAGQDNMREVETFVRTNLPALYRLAHALCQHQGSAEDLVANTLVTVVERWQTVTTAPLAFTRRTMINMFLNEVRHNKVVQEITVEHLPEISDVIRGDVADDVASRVDIARALSRLTPDLRVVLVLRFLADMSVSEVGLILGRPPGTIRRLTHDAIVYLRKDLLIEGISHVAR